MTIAPNTIVMDYGYAMSLEDNNHFAIYEDGMVIHRSPIDIANIYDVAEEIRKEDIPNMPYTNMNPKFGYLVYFAALAEAINMDEFTEQFIMNTEAFDSYVQNVCKLFNPEYDVSGITFNSIIGSIAKCHSSKRPTQVIQVKTYTQPNYLELFEECPGKYGIGYSDFYDSFKIPVEFHDISLLTDEYLRKTYLSDCELVTNDPNIMRCIYLGLLAINGLIPYDDVLCGNVTASVAK